jgi:hypothetical protein
MSNNCPSCHPTAAGWRTGTVLVWDVRGELERPKTPPTPAELENAWVGLSHYDMKAAFAAARVLAAFPDHSVTFLQRKPVPSGLRAIRTVEAVEWMGTPDAVKLLGTWAGGVAGATHTEEAKAALARLKRN